MPTPGSTFPTAWNRKECECYGKPDWSDFSADLPESKPYWDGLKEGKLMFPSATTAASHSSIDACSAGLPIATYQLDSGERQGEAYSFEIAYQTFNPAYKIKPPYIFAMIELRKART